jgi:hypothetical protein
MWDIESYDVILWEKNEKEGLFHAMKIWFLLLFKMKFWVIKGERYFTQFYQTIKILLWNVKQNLSEWSPCPTFFEKNDRTKASLMDCWASKFEVWGWHHIYWISTQDLQPICKPIWPFVAVAYFSHLCTPSSWFQLFWSVCKRGHELWIGGAHFSLGWPGFLYS